MLSFFKGYRRVFRVLLVALVVALCHSVKAAASLVPSTPTFWAPNGNVEFKQATSKQPAMLKINIGGVELKAAPFADGTIEYDVAELASDDGRDYPWLRFRQRDSETAEQIYLRPHASCLSADDCLQYAPVLNGQLMWDTYPQFQAGGPVHETGWNHIRLIVAGHRAVVFVNHSATPTLVIDQLASDVSSGRIELNGPALYRDIKISPGVIQDMPVTVARDPAMDDNRLLRTWALSPQNFVPPGPMPDYANMPTALLWTDIHAEALGFVNLTRRFSAAPSAVGALVWLRTTVTSNRDQIKRVAIGWTREVAVFVNGRPVFSEKNYYYGLPSTRRRPDGLLSLENGTFDLPLHKGTNEIAVALNNFFPGSHTHGGWGLKMQMHDLDGIRLVP